MKSLIRESSKIILESKLTIALTGAGVSTESGIPDFRSAGGLWSKFDPAEYATIDAFRKDPEKVWKMIWELESVVSGARPNKAHYGMGELEKMGLLQCCITQNVDNLHQEGGSKNVIEYHGNASTLSCLWCGNQYDAEEKKKENPPTCQCGKVLKPDVIFFGEAIPPEAMNTSFELANSSQALLVVGTSALVSPANSIPYMARQNGAKIIEINKERTQLTHSLTDVFLEGSAGAIISALVDEIKDMRG